MNLLVSQEAPDLCFWLGSDSAGFLRRKCDNWKGEITELGRPGSGLTERSLRWEEKEIWAFDGSCPNKAVCQ